MPNDPLTAINGQPTDTLGRLRKAAEAKNNEP